MSDRTSTEISGALTPEEWRHLEIRCGLNHRSVVEGTAECLIVTPVNIDELEFAGQYRHGLAALALHGQPYGFTRDDVEILKQLPPLLLNRGIGMGLGDDPNGVRNWIGSLAARIAALLPPTP